MWTNNQSTSYGNRCSLLINKVMKPHMDDKELNLFNEFTQHSNYYFEYGTGGSTVHVHDNSSAVIHGVDSSKPWIDKITKTIGVNERVNLEFIDIGPIGSWGTPIGSSHKDQWPDYHQSFNRIEKPIDTVLVDGRFRAACMLQIVKTCVDRELDPVIILHDATRPHYAPGKTFLTMIDDVSTLQIFKIDHDNVDSQLLADLMDQKKYDSR